VVSLLHVNALVVSLEIRLPHKLLVAIFQRARKWIFSAGIMGFHMRFKVVASAKKLATSFDMALEICIFFGGELSRVSRPSYGAWAAPLVVGTGLPSILTFRTPAVGWDW